MRRDRSPLEVALSYATFFTLSLVIHMFVILGDRPPPRALLPGPDEGPPARPAGERGP